MGDRHAWFCGRFEVKPLLPTRLNYQSDIHTTILYDQFYRETQ